MDQATATTEVWRAIPGFDGYEVSDTGEVRSWRSGSARVLSQVVDRGYPRVTLFPNGKRTLLRVHIAVLTAFVGERPDGMMARHLNDVPTDNRLVNLAWGTNSDNMMDSVRNGTHRNARKTHCPNGHEYAVSGVYVYAGSKRCAVCAKGKIQARYYRKKEKE